MVRLGLQLTLHSGREAFVRLLVTAAAVAVGVALLLGVLAEFHAGRPSRGWTSPRSVLARRCRQASGTWTT